MPTFPALPPSLPACQPRGGLLVYDWYMICQCQSAPGAGGAGMLPSAAKLSSQGRAKWKTRLPDRKVIKLTLCDCPFVMDSWPFFQLPATHFAKRRLVQQSCSAASLFEAACNLHSSSTPTIEAHLLGIRESQEP